MPYRRAWLLGLLFLFSPLSVLACDTPVFRYALERWHPSVYELLILHRGPMTEPQQAIFKKLQSAGLDDQGQINFTVNLVDASKPLADDLAKLVKPLGDALLPQLILRYPENPDLPVAWSAPLSAESADRLLNSPIRREIARRLIAGDAAVWVLLESGQAAADAAAEKLLQTELKRLEVAAAKAMKARADEDNGPPPIPVRFTILRIPRTDPAEAGFLDPLLNSDPQLRAQTGPIIVPIFGRARALVALADKMLTADALEQCVEFLTGPCTCEIKGQNPGFDLLFSADWSGVDNPAPPPDPAPALPALVQSAAPATQPATRPVQATLPDYGGLFDVFVMLPLGFVVAIAALFIAVLLGTMILRRRRME